MPIEPKEMTPIGATQYLELPGGRVAYDDTGNGPLLIATPAMWDLRSELRFLRPLLVQAGFRASSTRCSAAKAPKSLSRATAVREPTPIASG